MKLSITLFACLLVLNFAFSQAEMKAWKADDVEITITSFSADASPFSRLDIYLDSLWPGRMVPTMGLPDPQPEASFSIASKTGIVWVHTHSSISGGKIVVRNPYDQAVFVSNIPSSADTIAEHSGPGLDFVMPNTESPQETAYLFAALLNSVKNSWGKDMTWGEIIWRLEKTAINSSGQRNDKIGYGIPDFQRAANLVIRSTPLNN